MSNLKVFLLLEALGATVILFFGIIIHFIDTASTVFHSLQFGFWVFVLYTLGVVISYLLYLLEYKLLR